MSMDRNAVDDARAEDEAFAQVEREQGKERLARRLEAARQQSFGFSGSAAARALRDGDVLARVAALEERVAVLEGGQRTY